MASARIVLKYNVSFPKQFLYRQALYVGCQAKDLDGKDKSRLLAISEQNK